MRPGDIVKGSLYGDCVYLVCKGRRGQFRLIMLAGNLHHEEHLPSICGTFTSSEDWDSTEEDLINAGIRDTGVNIAHVLKNIREMI